MKIYFAFLSVLVAVSLQCNSNTPTPPRTTRRPRVITTTTITRTTTTTTTTTPSTAAYYEDDEEIKNTDEEDKDFIVLTVVIASSIGIVLIVIVVSIVIRRRCAKNGDKPEKLDMYDRKSSSVYDQDYDNRDSKQYVYDQANGSVEKPGVYYYDGYEHQKDYDKRGSSHDYDQEYQ